MWRMRCNDCSFEGASDQDIKELRNVGCDHANLLRHSLSVFFHSDLYDLIEPAPIPESALRVIGVMESGMTNKSDKKTFYVRLQH